MHILARRSALLGVVLTETPPSTALISVDWLTMLARIFSAIPHSTVQRSIANVGLAEHDLIAMSHSEELASAASNLKRVNSFRMLTSMKPYLGKTHHSKRPRSAEKRNF